jgi:hypothetical protein
MLKPTENQKIIENINTKNMFEKLTIHELNVSWNEAKIEVQICIKFAHKK